MKIRGTIGILLMGLILISTIACSSGDQETISQQPVETVQRDVNVTVIADGNIEASLQMRLTFGSGGKVDWIFVSKGDRVTEGDVLAKLDTAPLEMSLTRAQVTHAQAQIARTQSQIAQAQAQRAQAQAQVDVAQAQVSQDQAQAAYSQAQNTRIQALLVVDVAEEALEDAEDILDRVTEFLPKNHSKVKDAEISVERATLQYEAAQAQLEAAEAQLEAAEAQLGVVVSQVEIAVSRVEITELQLEITKPQLEIADLQVEATEQAMEEAQKRLDEATITAPFDGTVYKVGAKEGEFISPAVFTERTIVEIIDLSHMELTALVDELDVVKVKTGQKVMISVDAMPGTKLKGRVTYISPVAREPGVVLFESDDEEKDYEVKIDFDIPEHSPIRAGMNATAEIIVE
jgi:multidrug efflux pump subunit AcrA (membrane-fusion protein)